MDLALLGNFLGSLFIAALVSWVLFRGWRKRPLFSRVLGVLFALTFAAFANLDVSEKLSLELKGGDPREGYVKDGHYFIGNHSQYTEVSARFFTNTLRYQRISFGAAMILLSMTVLAFAIRIRYFPPPNPPKKLANQIEPLLRRA